MALAATMLESARQSTDSKCVWAGCGSTAEATLSRRPLCRLHFYEIASQRLAECSGRFAETLVNEGERAAALTLLSEIITQTTNLAASAKYLSASQRDQFLELSMSAMDVSKRIQRYPRTEAQILVALYRSGDPTRVCESTRTINISKRGACVETRISWDVGENLWIENSKLGRRALARTAWVTKAGATSGAMGIEILDWEDFWDLEQKFAK